MIITPPPGQQLFAAIKQTTRAGQPGLALPVGQPLVAVIRPIATVPGHTDALDVQLLTEWRNRLAPGEAWYVTDVDACNVRRAVSDRRRS
mgnify:CR=1 FL=1